MKESKASFSEHDTSVSHMSVQDTDHHFQKNCNCTTIEFELQPSPREFTLFLAATKNHNAVEHFYEIRNAFSRMLFSTLQYKNQEIKRETLEKIGDSLVPKLYIDSYVQLFANLIYLCCV